MVNIQSDNIKSQWTEKEKRPYKKLNPKGNFVQLCFTQLTSAKLINFPDASMTFPKPPCNFSKLYKLHLLEKYKVITNQQTDQQTDICIYRATMELKILLQTCNKYSPEDAYCTEPRNG